MESGKRQRHFVLVHGLCHGSWCWYKVATILESAGHRVTALDMAACGASAVRVEDVRSFEEYSRPLLDAVPPGEKAVLVGHSFGGHNLALAMQTHPEKLAVAVFVSAAVPVVGRPMSFVLEQHLKETSTPDSSFLGSTPGTVERGSEDPVETFLLGPEWMAQRMYQLSPPEDLTLATMLVRPAQMYLKDSTMSGDSFLTEGKYGAVSRVFVVTEEDKTWPAVDQRRVAASCGPGVGGEGDRGSRSHAHVLQASRARRTHHGGGRKIHLRRHRTLLATIVSKMYTENWCLCNKLALFLLGK